MIPKIFISYARVDDNNGGWVRLLCGALRSHPDLADTIFLDRLDIAGGDTWSTRLGQALADAQVLIVVRSPYYFASQHCLREWEDFHRYCAIRGIAVGSVVVLQVADVEEGRTKREFFAKLTEDPRGMDDIAARWHRWYEGVRATQYYDFSDSFRTRSFDDTIAADVLAHVRDRLAARIVRARRHAQVPNNLRSINPHFVGRSSHIAKLHEHLETDGRVGVVTAVHGLGGQGKTELALAYARSNLDAYAGGVWMMSAEGRTQLKPLIAALVHEPNLGLPPLERESDDDRAERVLARLRALAEEATARATEPVRSLLILDNLTDSRLLAPAEMEFLVGKPWLRVIVTTRQGPEHFPSTQRALGFVEVESLDEEDALALIHACQSGRDFTQKERDALRNIVRDLGGFTLAVEAVGLYLAHHSDICPSDYHARLRDEGLPCVDDLPAEHEVNVHIRHRDKQLQVILTQTLATLSMTERVGLSAAAYLPPDQIPLSWLRRTVEVVQPGKLEQKRGYPDRWEGPSGVIPRLVGYRLLTPAASKGFVRMHRMVAAHLRERREVDPAVIRRVVLEAANALDSEWFHNPTRLRELPSLEEMALGPPTWTLDNDARASLALVCASVEVQIGLSRIDLQFEQSNQAIGTSSKDIQYEQSNQAFRTRRFGEGTQVGYSARADELLKVALTTMGPASATNAAAHVVQHVRARRLKAEVLAGRGRSGDIGAAIATLEESSALGHRVLDGAETATQPSLLQELASTHNALSDQLQARSSAGDFGRSVEEATRAAELAERAVALTPDDWKGLTCASEAHKNIACLLASRGSVSDFEQADFHFTRSHELVRIHASAFPQSALARHEQAAYYANRSDVLAARGRPEDLETADNELRQAISILETLVEENPTFSHWRSELAYTFNKFAMFRQDRVGSNESLWALERANDLLEGVLSESFGSGKAKRDHATNQTSIVVSLAARRGPGDFDRALAQAECAVASLEAISAENPNMTQLKRDLQPALRTHADLLRERGAATDTSRIELAYLRVVRLAEEVLDANPESNWARRDLSIALNGLTDFIGARGCPDDVESALAACDRSVALCRAVCQSNPDSAQARDDLSVAINFRTNLLDARMAPGDTERLKRDHEESVILCTSSLRDNPESTNAKRDLSIALNRRAELLGVSRDHAEIARALEDTTESVRLCRAVLNASQSSAQAMRDLSIALNRRCDLLGSRSASGYADEIARCQEESIDLCAAILRGAPDSTQAKSDMSLALNNRYKRLVGSGGPEDISRAFADITDSVRLCSDVLQARPDSADARRDLFIALNHRSTFLDKRKLPGDVEQSGRDTEQACSLSAALLRDHPESLQAKRDMAISLHRKSEHLSTAESQKERSQAVSLLAESLELCCAILAANPESSQGREELVLVLGQLRTLRNSGAIPEDPARVQTCYERAAAVLGMAPNDKSQSPHVVQDLVAALRLGALSVQKSVASILGRIGSKTQ